jgi:hypothetical protein
VCFCVCMIQFNMFDNDKDLMRIVIWWEFDENSYFFG